jgi:transposase-like protein/IS1 family transposase
VRDRACPNPHCPQRGKLGEGNIVRHSFYRTKGGRRRRYRCSTCRKPFCSNSGTVYFGLQQARSAFDRVAVMSVEGVSKSSIARIMGMTWNTVARWVERAATAARQFNDRMLRGFDLIELQADEIRTIAPSKDRPVWIFATLDVCSRLWPSTVVGRRSYSNTRLLLRDTIRRSLLRGLVLVTTDGFKFYARVIHEILGSCCIYAQIIKTWRNDRVAKVEQRLVIGTDWQLQEALTQSEDSERLNTSFIERLNLTIRQSCAYLTRRSVSHARSKERLEEHLELVRCHYNFLRPHAALRFGTATKTPAMQAGLVNRRLTFRDIFLFSPPLPVGCLILSLPVPNPTAQNLPAAA